MADRQKAIEEFSSLFNNITSKPENQEEEQNNVENENTFEENVGEVSENLKNIESGAIIEPTEKENVHDVVKKICKEENIEKEIQQEDSEENIDFNEDDYDVLLDEIPVKESDNLNKSDEENKISNNDKNEDKDKEVKIIDGKIQWSLDSPVTLYNKFYKRKRELVEKYSGEQLNFKALNEELINASVDVTDEIFDQEIVRKKMEMVQQYRERVKKISITCNTQYFLWKRWIEKDMLKGYLAKIEYLKPSIKQEGLVLEHMGDLEYYYSQLEALYNNCYKVEKTLEAAYEMLSRKVSICMELKPIDRYDRSKRSNNYRENKSSELDDYDEISDGDVAKKDKIKSGVVGWGEF